MNSAGERKWAAWRAMRRLAVRALVLIPVLGALLPDAAEARSAERQAAIHRVDEIRAKLLRIAPNDRDGARTLHQRWNNWRNIWRNR